MQGYRVYFIGDDGHIKDRVEFSCPNEEAARAYARRLIDGQDVELWRDDHQIAVFKSSDARS
jgi:hypothetical protein